MAVAISNSIVTNASTGGLNLTYSYTVASGSNRELLVDLANTGAVDETYSSVEYNSVSMTATSVLQQAPRSCGFTVTTRRIRPLAHTT